MRQKITAKQTIKVMAFTVIFFWLMIEAYWFSNSPVSQIFNYQVDLLDKKISLLEEAKSKNNTNSSFPLSIYTELCKIDLCRNDFIEAQKSINTIINFISHKPESIEKADLYFFVANIYRDFVKFDQAQAKYQSSLAIIDQALSQALFDHSNKQKLIKAKILNNIGTNYFVQGKSAEIKKQRWKNYNLAKEYFLQAAQILSTLNNNENNLNRIVQTNLDQCSAEMQFLD